MSLNDSMQLDQLLRYFQTSPAIRLLRSSNAPFVIDFLYGQFKRSSQMTLLQSDLRSALTVYQDRLHQRYPAGLQDKSEVYLQQWSSGECRWLHRFIEGSQPEPSFQLTASTEKVLTFIEQALEQEVGFVGTESRLRLILELMQDMVVGASDDPQERLDYLYQQKERIERQIEEIQTKKQVTAYGGTQLRERFSMALSMLNQLQSDFRSVEEHLKGLTRQVQQRQLQRNQTKSGILQFALDQEDLLKREDQGISFFEFVKLLHAPECQERWASTVEQLSVIRELSDQFAGMQKLRGMMPMLLVEAERVLRTAQRLSDTLRRILDIRSSRHRHRLAEVLRDVQTLAMSNPEKLMQEGIGLEVEAEIDLYSPIEKSFWSPHREFDVADFFDQLEDTEERMLAFQQLVHLESLDWNRMKTRIREQVRERGKVSLEDLLGEYPPQLGIIEILGYVQLAHEDHHLIDQETSMEIEVDSRSGTHLTLQVPKITFVTHHDSNT